MEILKVPGIVQVQRTLLFQALLMEKCAGENAEAKNLHSSSLLVKCYDLLLLTNFAKLVIIYAFLSHFGEIL